MRNGNSIMNCRNKSTNLTHKLHAKHDSIMSFAIIFSVSVKIILITVGFAVSVDVLKPATAQNLESIGKADPVKVSGGVSVNNIFYAASRNAQARDPFMYVAAANVNIDLYGWSVPLSFTYSNHRGEFRQPFNQYGLSPTYKWITLHGGYRSMSFSPYTLNGHIFLGGGVDLTPPGKFKFSGMYGRFQKNVVADTISDHPPVFERWGTGFKAQYTSGANSIGLSFFRAWDKPDSVHMLAGQYHVFPMENMVWGLTGSTALSQHLTFSMDAAASALTRDLRSPADGNATHWMSRMPFLFTSRTSSSFHNALKSSLAYKADSYTLSAGYERIDPGYQTLGAYYFNNDLENITLGVATGFLQKRITLSVNAGTQRNNLDADKVNDMRRIVATINTGVTISQAVNLNLSYSNFQTYTRVNRDFQILNQLTSYDNLDTLNFVQVSQNANFSVTYSPQASKEYRKLLNAAFSYQSSGDRQQGANSSSRFYTGNVAYNHALIATGASFTLSMNTSYTENPGDDLLMAGPTAGLNRNFMDRKLRSSVSSSYNVSYAGNKLINRVLNFRWNTAYAVKKHNFSLGAVWLQRKQQREEARSNYEFTCTLGYNYSFSYE